MTFPIPPAPARPCAQNPAATKKPATSRFAQAELVVGRERLGAVDQLRDLRVLHRRHADLRVLGDLLEAVGLVLEKPAVEVGRDLVEAAGSVGKERRLRVVLVAAHDEPLAVLAVVDEKVGVAQGGEALARRALADRLRHHVLVGHRDHGNTHAGEAADLGRVHPARVHDDLALDPPAVRLDGLDPLVL